MPTLPLPVKLTDADRLVISRDQNEAISAEEVATEKKKEVTKEHNRVIKGHRKRIKELSLALISGTIDREVEVEDRADYARGVVETFRLDTKPPEVVKTRPIDPDERQIKLDTAIKKAIASDAKTAPLTDEQIFASSPEEAEELRAQRLVAEKKERERQDAAVAWLNGLQAKIHVFPAEEDEDGFCAKIGAVDGFAWTIMSADGQTEDEARKALGDQLIAQFILVAEKKERERQERILTKLGELIPKITVQVLEAGGAVARVEAETWISEADGGTEEDATKALRVKLIAILESHEDEIEKLTAEQGADAARSKSRVGLKAPAGAKGKKTKRAETDPPSPPGDDKGKDGLAF
jgi:hypothetical protein